MTLSTSAAWDDLGATIRGCVACPELAATRITVVVGERPVVGASVLLVGEAPGANEDETGVPFVGRAGQLLDLLLAEAGLPRSSVAVANVVKCRPPSNRKPARSEVVNCRGWLEQQIEIVDPVVICAMGGTAVEWFFGYGSKIGPLRGALHDVGGYRVVATYHPSAAIRFGPKGVPRAALSEDLAYVAGLAHDLQPQRGSR
jgi:uracil-DNA glycosylase family 4